MRKREAFLSKTETEEKEDSEVATVYEEDAALAAGKTEVKESGSPESTVTLLKIVKEDGENPMKRKSVHPNTMRSAGL